nr:MAG TPA: hypothetical protein [Caudoviricetes sp.]
MGAEQLCSFLIAHLYCLLSWFGLFRACFMLCLNNTIAQHKSQALFSIFFQLSINFSCVLRYAVLYYR